MLSVIKQTTLFKKADKVKDLFFIQFGAILERLAIIDKTTVSLAENDNAIRLCMMALSFSAKETVVLSMIASLSKMAPN